MGNRSELLNNAGLCIYVTYRVYMYIAIRILLIR